MPRIRRRTNLGRRTRNAMNQINYQSNRSAQERQDRNERERIRVRQTREARHSTNNGASLNRAAFCYDMSIAYSAYNSVAIGPMNSACQYCKALKRKNETSGLCCANGKLSTLNNHTQKLSISHTEILSTVPPSNPVVKEEELEKPVDEDIKQEAVCEEPRILINKVEPEGDDYFNNSSEAEPDGRG